MPWVRAQFGVFKRKARAAVTQPTLPTVTPEPSYRVPAAFFAVAGVLVVKGDAVPAAVVGILGGALTVLVSPPFIALHMYTCRMLDMLAS